MGCPHCGCRLVSRQPANPSGVICSDCGHPMTTHLRSLRPQPSWGDLGAMGMVLLIGFSALGLTTVKTVIIGQQEGAPSAAEHQSRGHHLGVEHGDKP